MKIGTLFTQSILASLLFCSVSQAGWNEFWDRAHLDYARNKCWPSPFIEQDRAAVNNYYTQMTAAGIRLQNTLSDHYFDQENGELSRAGLMKIRAILTSTEGRRDIFVMQGFTKQETDARIAAVKAGLAELVGNPDAAPIYVSPDQPAGRAADYIDDIWRRERSSVPVPRLPAFSGDQ